VLLCGVSTQLQASQANWDESISSTDPDFAASGLRRPSIVRLRFLHAATSSELVGVIGTIEAARLGRLRTRLADHLRR